MMPTDKSGPLDGSTSGTIGGGGAETGGPTERPHGRETPEVRPENAASGRRAPDPIGATAEPDPTPVTVNDETEEQTDVSSERD